VEYFFIFFIFFSRQQFDWFVFPGIEVLTPNPHREERLTYAAAFKAKIDHRFPGAD